MSSVNDDRTVSPLGQRRPPSSAWRTLHFANRRLALLFAALTAIAAATSPAPAAELRVTGMGPFGSRETTRSLQLLLGDQLAPETIDAPPIEDAALILYHELQQDGYLDARITAAVTAADGSVTKFPITADLSEPLPRPLAARGVELQVERGTRFLIREIEFSGLSAMTAEAARGFFTGETMLVPLAADRVYSPAGVRNSAGNLEEELRLRGHADAAVTIAHEEVDHTNGAVRLAIAVHEGPVWRVDAVNFLERAEPMTPPEFLQERLGQAWSPLWRQDAATAVRRWYFERGFPDVRVRVAPRLGEQTMGRQSVTAEIRVQPGAQLRLGDVRLAGNTHTQERTMRRMLKLKPGELLNPIEIDNAQARLSRLGVFNRIDVRYEDAGVGVRDAVFDVTEGRLQEVNLLAGYGSYEQLRAGVEWQHSNLFGRAHTNNLRLVQSMKSTSLDNRYTVPSLFGTEVDGSARLFALRREELSFVREEYGANLSLSRAFPSIHSTATASYNLRRLRSSANELATSPIDQSEANVASVDLRLVRDRRDNPLSPRAGHRLFAQVEFASKVLGGEVDYQQLQLGASYHRAIGRSRWLHLGLEHAVVTTFGADDDRALPVNVRFFPGGDASIRGYNRGEAAPRAANGQFVGAKTYLQFNVELEQAITPKFSVVLFGDALGTAAQLADYPLDDRLYSVGLGLRYHTIIGPLRIEYGRNLNPRPLDPSGTLLLSIGFPF
ncbi:MAG: outer membrane protein assembly factor [Opitutus sp.]|nr:outer membrane protein assembly factor [Opitutus sp.]